MKRNMPWIQHPAIRSFNCFRFHHLRQDLKAKQPSARTNVERIFLTSTVLPTLIVNLKEGSDLYRSRPPKCYLLCLLINYLTGNFVSFVAPVVCKQRHKGDQEK